MFWNNVDEERPIEGNLTWILELMSGFAFTLNSLFGPKPSISFTNVPGHAVWAVCSLSYIRCTILWSGCENRPDKKQHRAERRSAIPRQLCILSMNTKILPIGWVGDCDIISLPLRVSQSEEALYSLIEYSPMLFCSRCETGWSCLTLGTQYCV